MKTMIRIALAMAVGGAELTLAAAGAPPRVEVAFVLDTTGSMGGLIEGAKAKIWAIANEIAKGKPTPEIHMALVAYRDKGDAYVTRATAFSDNLDNVYKDLMGFKAEGGGDAPEHVWKALQVAVNELTWSSDPKAFRVIYLVGDAPAHSEYGDTPAINDILERAVRKGIVVNAVQCGADSRTTAEWQAVARRAEGTFLAIAQDGGVAVVPTPFDTEIAALSARLGDTALGYGAAAEGVTASRLLSSKVVAMSAPSAAADRAAYRLKGGYAAGDLLASVAKKTVNVESISEKELPKELQGLSKEELKAKVAELLKERQGLEKALKELTEKRSKFLTEARAKGPKSGFDQEVVESLKIQAAKKGIAY